MCIVLTSAACLACTGTDAVTVSAPVSVGIVKGCEADIVIQPDCGWEAGVGCTDLLIYRDEGAHTLERHIRMDSREGGPTGSMEGQPTQSEIPLDGLSPGDKTAVVILNMPYRLKDGALDRYESAEMLTCRFGDEDPLHPMMSGTASFTADTSVTAMCMVKVRPLMCRITLCEVSNALGGDVLLERPSVGLRDCNHEAEILRMNGFRSSEQVADTSSTMLPFDIGVFTQHPGISLYCYPNDAETPTAADPPTRLVFACFIEGLRKEFDIPVPGLGRAESRSVSLTVNSPEDCSRDIW